jgi:uridine kinase
MDLAAIVDRVADLRAVIPPRRATLVAISGIDASGKGWVAARLASGLRARGMRVADLCVDGWLRLPSERFGASDPAGHFYRHALRFDAMFSQVVLPVRNHRSVHVEVDHADEIATTFRPRRYDLTDVDIILLEGIFLLRRDLRAHYDASIWIDCSIETALERAIGRGQEGLAPAATIHAYRTIYFPAQEIHFAFDDPRAACTWILVNDPRLVAAGTGQV